MVIWKHMSSLRVHYGLWCQLTWTCDYSAKVTRIWCWSWTIICWRYDCCKDSRSDESMGATIWINGWTLLAVWKHCEYLRTLAALFGFPEHHKEVSIFSSGVYAIVSLHVADGMISNNQGELRMLFHSECDCANHIFVLTDVAIPEFELNKYLRNYQLHLPAL